MSEPSPRAICVYCGSSRRCDTEYLDVAYRLGCLLADRGWSIVYGGGGGGSMGALADGALSKGGHVLGIIPQFMRELEWGHTALPELRVVEDLAIRKELMLRESQGVVALPGGSGTFDELLEAITMKRLGLYPHPIVLVDTKRFFEPLVELLERSVAERFMDERHLQMWQLVSSHAEVPEALEQAPEWPSEARDFAALL